MDLTTVTNALLVLLFVLIGGVFAGTELALVSLRESQIDRLERQSRRGARVASVARDPNRFLAAVQIGVTLAGFFSAAYGASTLAPDVAPVLERLGFGEAAAETAALVVMTLAVAYLSLVLGELVPKRLALQRAATVSLVVGPPLDRFATLMRPVVWLLSVSTNAVVRLLGGDPTATTEEMTEDELRDLVVGHTGLAEDERRILDDVFDAGDRTLGEVMRPRGEVVFLSGRVRVVDALPLVQARPFSRYPVTGDGFDDVLGFIHVRDLLGVDGDRTLAAVARPILHLPVTNRLLPSLSAMRSQGQHIAVVVDEYGGTDGIVTLEDMVEELVGEIHDEYDVPEPVAHEDAEGHQVVDAGVTIEEFAEITGVELADGPYETAAGFVVHRLGRLAVVGDRVRVREHELVVTATEGRRLTRLLVRTPDDPARTPEG
ncbi:hemolysin family protein [Actinotalea sp. M2MS4P-6]|uniref:hemolysin family protein n=1 Tax=Actinotalea sp. M2MS4P-6 TaxID=2983762 RepID=UPI0021E4A424|nr:hemolysin family protein [Actinotalea sp. M2MS4P-6]MCV2394670.1 hemolysin family protein [Actinotalea sp. M2MS4P-6]